MKLLRHLGVAVASLCLPLFGAIAVAGASGDPSFACVSVDVDTCTVTIPLTSNMNEQVGSTMPDSQPWYFASTEGNGAPYGITGPGNPQTTWDGVGGAIQGTVWTAILTTGANEPAGGMAIISFVHVTSTTTTTVGSQSYNSLYESYPVHPHVGSVVTITAVVHPVPLKGHLVLVRRSGSTWVGVGSFTYSASAKRWSIKFKWRFPKHATETFRLLATASPGLTTTYGGNFKISTFV
jgi:hypothetical protein